MKRILYPTLCTLALASALSGSVAYAQDGDTSAKLAPIIVMNS